MILAPVLIIAAFVGIIVVNEAKAVETQKVCHEVKGKQVCKMVKIHKKIEDATVIPEKKKK